MDVEHPDLQPPPAGEARPLAEQAGCTEEGESFPASLGGPYGAGGWECVSADGTWSASVVSGLQPDGVEATVERLNRRYVSGIRCADGSLSNPGVVSGPDWVAFVSDHEAAALVADRLDGHVRPNAIAGPPIDILNQLCPIPRSSTVATNP
jgi:hypothetical protein